MTDRLNENSVALEQIAREIDTLTNDAYVIKDRVKKRENEYKISLIQRLKQDNSIELLKSLNPSFLQRLDYPLSESIRCKIEADDELERELASYNADGTKMKVIMPDKIKKDIDVIIPENQIDSDNDDIEI